MKKCISLIVFLFFISFVFSQNKNSRGNVKTDRELKTKDSITKVLALYNIELANPSGSLKNNALPTPELKSFSIHQTEINGKENDTTIIAEPKLIPYSGYEKDNDN